MKHCIKMLILLLFLLSFFNTTSQHQLLNKLIGFSNSSLPFLSDTLTKNLNQFDLNNLNLTLEKSFDNERLIEIDEFKNLNDFYGTTIEDQQLAKRMDDYDSLKKSASSSLLNLLTSSQRRISPLNKVILGLIGPRLIKMQLDMMFGAVLSEVIRKLFMPVLSFVIDKNNLGSGNTDLNQQVPYSNLQDLTTSKLVSTTPAPSSQSSTKPESQIDLANPLSFYKQIQSSNYLTSNPSLQEMKTSQTAKNTENQDNQSVNHILQQQIQSIIYEQNKLKQQLQSQLTNSQSETNSNSDNYLAKESPSQTEQKSVSDQSVIYDDNLEEQSLNQMEQDYDRAQRWNSVLKNIHEFNKDEKKT